MKRFSFNQKALSDTAAHQILSNVFHICDIEPNSVSLDTIQQYSNYRKQRFLFQKSTIYSALALYLVLPILFITGSVIWSASQSPTSVAYTVKSDSIIPAMEIEAVMDGHRVAATELDDGVYLLSPTSNGDMHVTITLKNRQTVGATISVTGIDETVPSLIGIDYRNGLVYITVEDAASGINWERTYAVYEDGTYVEGFTALPELGQLALPYPSGTVFISIPDMCGNTLSVQLNRT